MNEPILLLNMTWIFNIILSQVSFISLTIFTLFTLTGTVYINSDELYWDKEKRHAKVPEIVLVAWWEKCKT